MIGAAAIVAAIHLVMGFVWPEPRANEFLRTRAAEASRQCMPRILIAGDSRTYVGLDERRLNDWLGLDRGEVVNLSVHSGDTTVFLAGYREFAHRFAPEPIILVGMSFFSVNDGATETLQDELLWSLPFSERLQIVPAAQATANVFLPEKFLWLRLTAPVHHRFAPRLRHTLPVPASLNMHNLSPAQKQHNLTGIKQLWYSQPNIDGLRWREFERNIRALRDDGAQLVVLDLPFHPQLTREIAGTPLGAFDERFRSKVAELCRELKVPLRQYGTDDLQTADLDAVFADFIHFNETGAALMTDCVARDLTRLCDSGQVRLPQPPVRSRQPYETTAWANR